MSIIERPLSDKEIKFLKLELKRVDKRQKSLINFLFGWTFVALIVGVILYLQAGNNDFLIGSLVFILIGLSVYLQENSRENKKRKGIDFAFMDNKVQSIRVISTDYIFLPEVEDEGAHYLFQIEENKILSLGGQDFYPSSRFPSNDFEIVRCFDKDGKYVLLEKYNYGNKIKPIRKIKGKEKTELMSKPNYPDYENFGIIEGRVDDIEQLLKTKV